MTIVQRIPLK